MKSSHLKSSVSVNDIAALKISIATAQDILSWSYGEVLKPETINYRTQRPERGGLFCEKIFGTTKNYQCYCGKYKRIRHKGVVCDRCGVEVTHSSVRRERMGHIRLAVPVVHPWFLRSNPGVLSKVLDIPQKKLEQVIYFAGHIVTYVDEDQKKSILDRINDDYKKSLKNVFAEYEIKNSESLTSEEQKSLKIQKESDEVKIREEFTSTKNELSLLTVKNVLSGEQYLHLSIKYGTLFRAGIGASAILEVARDYDLNAQINRLTDVIKDENTPEAKIKPLKNRLRILRSFDKSGIQIESMFITIFPVIPPDLRPVVELDGGRFTASDLNDLYRRVISRNNRLKSLLGKSAPDVITRNEMRMLQESVDALIDKAKKKTNLINDTKDLKSISDILKGKQGRFRQNLLGKRVDYSGRAVIVPGPELKMDQCGLPKEIAIEIFEPFLLGRLIELGFASNIKSAKRMISERQPQVWDALSEVVSNRLVLLNRAPTFHSLSMLAFKPILIDGNAIRLHTSMCPGFNADFDGDAMAVHLPLSHSAQKEAREIMVSTRNVLRPTSGELVAMPIHETVLGIYYLTFQRNDFDSAPIKKYLSSEEEVSMALDAGSLHLHDKIYIHLKQYNKGIITTAGRVLFNHALGFREEFVNAPGTKKYLEKLFKSIYSEIGPDKTCDLLDQVKELGLKYATLSGLTTSVDDFIVPEQKYRAITEAEKKRDEYYQAYKNGFITNEERVGLIEHIWNTVKDDLGRDIKENIRNYRSVGYIIESGARGNFENLLQITGMIGLIKSLTGRTMETPVKGNYIEGLTPLEYFLGSYQSRKGMADKNFKVPDAGYLTRRMCDVGQDIIITDEDCGTNDGLELTRQDCNDSPISIDFGARLLGRFVLKEFTLNGRKIAKDTLVTKDMAEEISKSDLDVVTVRSPFGCKSTGICRKCYGVHPAKGEAVDIGAAVGVVAATSIGEPSAQLMLKAYHVDAVDVVQGFPRLEELFEGRSKIPAVVSPVDGVVSLQSNKGGETFDIIITSSEGEKFTYPNLSSNFVKTRSGQPVKKGDILTLGSPNPHELYEIMGTTHTQKYTLQEILKVFAAQGVTVKDVHIETIVRKMFSFCYVADSGDSNLIDGSFVSKETAQSENDLVDDTGKKAELQDVLLGISKAALSTDSFLSAASFEETTNVLINAAIQSKVDHLTGLKENIMIGRLIPAGSGFTKDKVSRKSLNELEKIKID